MTQTQTRSMETSEIIYIHDLGEGARRFSYNVFNHSDSGGTVSVRCLGYIDSRGKEIQVADTVATNASITRVIDCEGYTRIGIGITAAVTATVDISSNTIAERL